MGREGQEGENSSCLPLPLPSNVLSPSLTCKLAFAASGRKECSGLGPQGCCPLGLRGGGLISGALQSRGNTRPLSQSSLVPGDGWLGWAACSPPLAQLLIIHGVVVQIQGWLVGSRTMALFA